MYIVAIKNGTDGYYNEDGCDKIIAEIPSDNIPAIEHTLEFGDKDNNFKTEYLVKGIKHTFNFRNERCKFKESIYVYVIKKAPVNLPQKEV